MDRLSDWESVDTPLTSLSDTQLAVIDQLAAAVK